MSLQFRARLAQQRAQDLQLTQKLIGMRLRISGNREKPIDRILKNILLLNVSLPSLPPA